MIKSWLWSPVPLKFSIETLQPINQLLDATAVNYWRLSALHLQMPSVNDSCLLQQTSAIPFMEMMINFMDIFLIFTHVLGVVNSLISSSVCCMQTGGATYFLRARKFSLYYWLIESFYRGASMIEWFWSD